MSLALGILFYLGIPVFMAVTHTVRENAWGAVFPSKVTYFLHALAGGLPAWLLYDLFSGVAARLLRPWRPNLLFVLTVGCALGFIATAPLMELRSSLFEPSMVEGTRPRSFWPIDLANTAYLTSALFSLAQTLVLWLGANLVVLKVFSVSRYGYVGFPYDDRSAVSAPAQSYRPGSKTADPSLDEAADSDSPGTDATQPRFMKRVRPAIGTDLVAIEAQEHYLKVHTILGTELILYRFGDAVSELEQQTGFKVHRSFWISRRHIAQVVRAADKLHVEMTNGLIIPVSRSHRIKLEEAGLL
jgi:DNA-binding LytR/AlgR family response regulator